ncbi:MAG: DUF1152 domain-containing protein, partial [Ignisphaera sp.]
MKTSRASSLDICLNIKNSDKVLFLAMGGGGDVAMAATLALSYERCGGKAVIGSILWERYVIDPLPGPISINELFNVVEKDDDYAILNKYTFALRGGRVVVPQAINVSAALNREVVVFDIYGGSKGLAKALDTFRARYGVKEIIGVDVGGDVIAEGFEENLWSPLADAIVVAALSHLDSTYIAIASPSADGELQLDYIDQRLRRIARLGGYIGGYILSSRDLEILRQLLKKVTSEASAIPLKVTNTDLDTILIRKESRSVKLSMMELTVFILDAVTVVRDSIARYVYETNSFNEARYILNKLTIVTEYDLEEEIFKELVNKGNYTEID